MLRLWTGGAKNPSRRTVSGAKKPSRPDTMAAATRTGRCLVHVVIMGCGRVGSELAARLESGEHTVSVIDKNPSAFRMLRYQFKGQKVEGYGFDEDVLA